MRLYNIAKQNKIDMKGFDFKGTNDVGYNGFAFFFGTDAAGRKLNTKPQKTKTPRILSFYTSIENGLGMP